MLNGNGEQSLYEGMQEVLENVRVRVCPLERYHLSKDMELPGEKHPQ